MDCMVEQNGFEPPVPFVRSEAAMLQGNWDEGATYLRKANALHRSAGLVSQLMWAKLDETELLAHQGRIDAGLGLIADAIADSEELVQTRPPALRYRAELLGQNHANAAAAVHVAYRAALDCARGQGAKYYELLASTSYARWLNSQGRSVEAQTLLAEIYGWFTEGFDTPALSEAKALLDELNTKLSTPRRSDMSRRGSIGTKAE